MRPALIIAVLAIAAAAPANARPTSLEDWFDRELVPHVSEQLSSFPRFKNETLMFVVLTGNRAAPVSNALALRLRDRLLEAALAMPMVNVAWQQQVHETGGCVHDEPDYLVGLDLSRDIDGRFRITVRALDVTEQSWVNGFGRTWSGTLSARELKAFRNTETDPAFRGTREVPYDASQGDLIARHLSHRLACDIHRALDNDYVIAFGETPGDEPLANTVALATRNLDEDNAIVVTRNADAANASIHGEALAIDGALHQYWLSVTPHMANADLDSLSTSVYVRLPVEPGAPVGTAAVERPAPQPASVNGVEIPGGGNHLLEPLRLYRAGRRDYCGAYNQECSVLQARASRDVIVFTLVHDANGGLKRIADETCASRTAPRVVTAGHSALFTVGSYGSAQSRNASHRWRISPANTTYYAIAVDNARDARRIGALIDQLPADCRDLRAGGISGRELQGWLESFSHLMLELGRHVQWRSIEVGNVYQG